MISTIENAPIAGLLAEVEHIFSEKGVLSRSPNFEFRPQQQQMAVAVARALQDQSHLLVEAGTGVGKSFGYLIPSVLFAVAQRKKRSFPPTPSISRNSSSKKIFPSSSRFSPSNSPTPCSRVAEITSAPAASTKPSPRRIISSPDRRSPNSTASSNGRRRRKTVHSP